MRLYDKVVVESEEERVMSFASVLAQMIVMLLGMAAGYLARKCGVMNDTFDRGFSDLVLGVTLPCMVIASVFGNEQLPDAPTILFIFAISTSAFVVMFAVAFLIPIIMRAPKKDYGVYRYMVVFGNIGFLGMPVVASIFGPDAVLYVAIANIPFNVFVFTVGIMLIAGNQGGTPKEKAVQVLVSLKTPATISCFIAVVLALLGITEAGVIGEAMDVVGSMTTPAAMLIIGSSMAKMPLKQVLGNPRAYVAAIARVGIVPLCLLLVFGPILQGQTLLLGILVITNGMPVATNGTLFCIRYGGNLEVMTQATFISTVLSLVTIPLFAMLIV